MRLLFDHKIVIGDKPSGCFAITTTTTTISFHRLKIIEIINCNYSLYREFVPQKKRKKLFLPCQYCILTAAKQKVHNWARICHYNQLMVGSKHAQREIILLMTRFAFVFFFFFLLNVEPLKAKYCIVRLKHVDYIFNHKENKKKEKNTAKYQIKQKAK